MSEIHMDISFKPTGDKIVVKVDKKEDKTSSGIYLPDVADADTKQGKVVAVGPGRMLDSGQRNQVTIEIGDNVVFSKISGAKMSIAGEDYLVMNEVEVFVVL